MPPVLGAARRRPPCRDIDQAGLFQSPVNDDHGRMANRPATVIIASRRANLQPLAYPDVESLLRYPFSSFQMLPSLRLAPHPCTWGPSRVLVTWKPHVHIGPESLTSLSKLWLSDPPGGSGRMGRLGRPDPNLGSVAEKPTVYGLGLSARQPLNA